MMNDDAQPLSEVHDQPCSEVDGKKESANSSSPMRTQARWRFFHDGAGALADSCSYTLRQAIKARLPNWPHLSVTLRTGARSIALTSRDAAATDWMVANMGDLMRVIADQAGRDLMVDAQTLTVGLRKDERRLYTIPRLVVERSKKSGEWASWNLPDLPDDKLTAMTDFIKSGLLSELQRWGIATRMDSLSGVRVIDAGRPMPLVPKDGPRGMGRLGVRFIAPWDIEGELFVGHHPLLGYGLAIKNGEIKAQARTETADEGAAA